MRILHVTPSYFPAVRYGGPIWSVHGLAKAQAALGHDVEVYTTNIDGPGVSDVPVGSPVELDGVKVTYFGLGFGRRLARSSAMTKALIETIASFDIVHTHSVFLLPTTAAARAARKAGVPYVISPRGMLWKEVIAQRSKAIKTAWISLFERANVKGASALHVTADLEANKLGEFGFTLPPFINLPNGVDAPETYSKSKVSPDIKSAIKDEDYILTLGRLSWKKNNIALIRALKNIPDQRLIIAGNEEDGHASELEAEVQHLGLAERVKIIARQVSGADKEALFAKASMFVLPSLSENMGNTILEAMIRELPVIASCEAGVSEVVASVGCGLVCAPEPDALAKAVNALLKNKTKTKQMAKLGEIAARSTYSWTAIAKSMTESYPVKFS